MYYMEIYIRMQFFKYTFSSGHCIYLEKLRRLSPSSRINFILENIFHFIYYLLAINFELYAIFQIKLCVCVCVCVFLEYMWFIQWSEVLYNKYKIFEVYNGIISTYIEWTCARIYSHFVYAYNNMQLWRYKTFSSATYIHAT